MPSVNADQLKYILSNSANKTVQLHPSLNSTIPIVAGKMATSIVYDIMSSPSASSVEFMDDKDMEDYDLVTPVSSRRNSLHEARDEDKGTQSSTIPNTLPSNNVGPFPHLASITPMPYAASAGPSKYYWEAGFAYHKPASYTSNNVGPSSSLASITPRPYDVTRDGPVLSKVFNTTPSASFSSTAITTTSNKPLPATSTTPDGPVLFKVFNTSSSAPLISPPSSTSTSISTRKPVGWSSVVLPAQTQSKPTHSPSLPTANIKLAYARKIDCSCWYCNGTDPSDAEPKAIPTSPKAPAAVMHGHPSCYEEALEDYNSPTMKLLLHVVHTSSHEEAQDAYEAPGCVAISRRVVDSKVVDVESAEKLRHALAHSTHYEDVQEAYVASCTGG